MDTIYGMPVVIDKNCETRTWIYPKVKFWAYKPSAATEKWCRAMGYGHQEYRPGCFMVGGKLVIHPELWGEIRKETADGNALASHICKLGRKFRDDSISLPIKPASMLLCSQNFTF